MPVFIHVHIMTLDVVEHMGLGTYLVLELRSLSHRACFRYVYRYRTEVFISLRTGP